MLVAEDRIKETTSSTGAVVTLLGAATNYRTFAAVCAVLDYVRITRVHQTANEWETGLYQYTAANELTRVSFESSSTGAAVTFSAGTQDIFLEHTSALAALPMVPDTLNRCIYMTDASLCKPGSLELGASGILELIGTSLLETT